MFYAGLGIDPRVFRFALQSGTALEHKEQLPSCIEQGSVLLKELERDQQRSPILQYVLGELDRVDEYRSARASKRAICVNYLQDPQQSDCAVQLMRIGKAYASTCPRQRQTPAMQKKLEQKIDSSYCGLSYTQLQEKIALELDEIEAAVEEDTSTLTAGIPEERDVTEKGLCSSSSPPEQKEAQEEKSASSLCFRWMHFFG